MLYFKVIQKVCSTAPPQIIHRNWLLAPWLLLIFYKAPLSLGTFLILYFHYFSELLTDYNMSRGHLAVPKIGSMHSSHIRQKLGLFRPLSWASSLPPLQVLYYSNEGFGVAQWFSKVFISSLITLSVHNVGYICTFSL